MLLTDIFIYPIKSLAGIQLKESLVEPIGLFKDRNMMLVDDNGIFISQRKYPQLALIKTRFENQSLILSITGRYELIIGSFQSKSIAVEVWKSPCFGFVAKNKINQWFSSFLNVSVRLVNYDNQQPRISDPEYSRKDDIVSYADGFPLLITTQASLDELNSRLEVPVSMLNFRPNLVIDGIEAFDEDSWKSIKIGDVKFDAVKPCSRCILTTVDPTTGVKSPNGQPLKTLSQYRKTAEGVIFGMNLIPRSCGIVRRGDLVSILK